MRSIVAVLSGVAMMATFVVSSPVSAQADGPFTQVEAFAHKTGFRLVFAWEASEPVSGVVLYGSSPDALDLVAQPLPGAPDTAQMAVAHVGEPGGTYYYVIEDQLSGARSPVGTVEAANAYNDWDGSTYTLDMLVQLDSQSLPADIPADQALEDIAAGMNVFAERLYDAMDGYARLGNVLVTDTNLDYAANAPFLPPGCFIEHSNVADVLVQTTIPFDSHTFGGWAIDDPCIAFYVGRLGQLVVPWEDDLHFGYVATHEMMHYGFNAPDLYAESGSDADCRNLDWDGSLMHNTGGWNGSRWELSELDRNQELTPCDHGSEPWTWDVLRERYTGVPAPTAPQNVVDTLPRGNPDGGALNVMILDREPGSSTLTSYEPVDTGAEGVDCSGRPPVLDAQEDATGFVITPTPAPNEPSLDILAADFSWDGTALTSHVTVDDLTADPPPGATGRYVRFYFTHGNAEYALIASQDAIAGEEYRLLDVASNTTIASGLDGAFDVEGDDIRVVLPASVFAGADPDAPPLAEGATLVGLEVLAQRLVGALTPTADEAIGECPYVIEQESGLTGMHGRAQERIPDGRGPRSRDK